MKIPLLLKEKKYYDSQIFVMLLKLLLMGCLWIRIPTLKILQGNLVIRFLAMVLDCWYSATHTWQQDITRGLHHAACSAFSNLGIILRCGIIHKSCHGMWKSHSWFFDEKKHVKSTKDQGKKHQTEAVSWNRTAPFSAFSQAAEVQRDCSALWPQLMEICRRVDLEDSLNCILMSRDSFSEL